MLMVLGLPLTPNTGLFTNSLIIVVAIAAIKVLKLSWG